jgi:predicted AAA+ superfamily ATPase
MDYGDFLLPLGMISRMIESRLFKMMKQFPAVGLIGPRQCGKTTVALSFQKKFPKKTVYFDLESPADLRKFSDPELFIQQLEADTIIIDEVQRMPELFSVLRSLIDKKKKPGRFLLLGSASPELVRGTSETLAGRIFYIDAAPFNLTELQNDGPTQKKHWFRGGFPDAFLAKKDSDAYNWMNGFVRTFVERDLNLLFGTSFSPQLMFRIWRMLAHHHGGVWNAQSFGKGLDISPTTVNRYLDHLEGAFMVRKLPPYYVNSKKRLIKSPKVYLRDSGLLHYLLDISKSSDLPFHPQVGYSWEGYAIEQIIQLLPHTIQACFYRTHDGSEMDLVLVKGIKPLACIEIKLTTSPSLTKGMTESIKDLKCRHNYIITPSQDASYPLNKQVTAIGLHEFLAVRLPKLVK